MDKDKVVEALRSMVLIVDTREHITDEFLLRIGDTGLPYTRRKLDFGDYACMVTLDTGKVLSMEKAVVIERKMSLDELATCFCSQRERFVEEFERARAARAKTYLIVENGSFDKIINHEYGSQMNPNAFLASLFAFMARYRCIVGFCTPEKTGRVIREIMMKETAERLFSYD